jgi:hypothetical protein
MELTTRLGTEVIQREAILVLYNGLNDMITSMNSTWASEDEEFWTALNRGNQDWFVETIEDQNFYAGTIPSLINAPIENYPNVCAICYISTPPGSTDDDGELYNNVLAIEVMVKSINSEEEVNSRIQKTLDAINLTFMDSLESRTLNNTIPMINAPRMSIGDVFIRKERTNVGDRWFWQGGVLEYVVNKFMDFN